MLKRIIITDFYAFKNENIINLNPGVNLLLGINGSGKTSFINALRLLYEGVSGKGMQELVQSWGGYQQMVNYTGEEQSECIKLAYIFDYKRLKELFPKSPFSGDITYAITIYPLGNTNYTLCESLYAPNSRNRRKFIYLQFRNGVGELTARQEDGTILPIERYGEGDISGQELVLRQITDPQRYLPLHIIKRAIEAMAIYNSFDLTRLRKPSDFNSSLRLLQNGSNLTHLLNELKNNSAIAYQKLKDTISDVNSDYIGFGFNILGSQLYLSLIEKNLNRSVDALHISEGTLRFLLMMSIFYNPHRGAVVGLDEPETGLHPDMIRSLAKMVKYAAKNTQIIMATHSPLLLNAFKLKDILVFEKTKLNCTYVRQYKDNDFMEFENVLPGQLWLNGQIGGTRW